MKTVLPESRYWEKTRDFDVRRGIEAPANHDSGYYVFLKGIKGEAGVKGALGRFGARGPVGQKVR